MSGMAAAEVVDDLSAFGIRAFTTGREAGSFSLAGAEPVGEVIDRWSRLRSQLRPGGSRLATASQVHGSRIVVHGPGWEGWLRADAADGHVALERGTVLAVTVADCVPVFIAHPSGAIALLHSGWRGTAARILDRGVAALTQRGLPAAELRVYLGPAICGECYEVSPDVFAKVTGRNTDRPKVVDLRNVLAEQARALGISHISTSRFCTKCDNERFYSHRAGDAGRQVSVIVTEQT